MKEKAASDTRESMGGVGDTMAEGATYNTHNQTFSTLAL